MKKKTALGLIFVAISVMYPVTIAGGTEYIDLVPDFIGFLLICLGLDRMSYYNRYFRDASNIAVMCLITSFITLVGQISPLFTNYLINSSVGSGLKAVAILVAVFDQIAVHAEFLLDAIYMIFISYFCYASASELNKRFFTAEDRKSSAWKGPHGDMMYSKKAYGRYETLSKIFCIIYAITAVVLIINQIYAYIVPQTVPDAPRGMFFTLYDYKISFRIIFMPIDILFILYANAAVPMISGPRTEPDPNF